MSRHTIRERCHGITCKQSIDDVRPIIDISDEYGEWSHKTGWRASIECPKCGRRVEYIGASYETKKSIETKVRAIWRVASEVVS